MSGFEIITITFSFILGLGVAQVLRSIAYVVREKHTYQLHWIPFSVAAIVLFFQVQFWFGLVVVNSIVELWTWPVYSLMLFLAMIIFLAGATVLPPPSRMGDSALLDDFHARGRISLLFIAVYLLGWIVLGMMFWIPGLWKLAAVNGSMAALAIVAHRAQSKPAQTGLHLLLIAATLFGMFTVWTTPSLQMPL